MMPVVGVSSSAASFNQAFAARTSSGLAQALAQDLASKRQFTLSSGAPEVPIRTSGGPGGGPVWMFTAPSAQALYAQLEADGYNAVRLAPTQFQSTYGGHLLMAGYHLLNPAFSPARVDFHA